MMIGISLIHSVQGATFPFTKPDMVVVSRDRTVTGKVRDEKGEPLVGVTVSVKSNAMRSARPPISMGIFSDYSRKPDQRCCARIQLRRVRAPWKLNWPRKQYSTLH